MKSKLSLLSYLPYYPIFRTILSTELHSPFAGHELLRDLMAGDYGHALRYGHGRGGLRVLLEGVEGQLVDVYKPSTRVSMSA